MQWDFAFSDYTPVSAEKKKNTGFISPFPRKQKGENFQIQFDSSHIPWWLSSGGTDSSKGTSESSVNMDRLDIERVYLAKILIRFWLYSYLLEILRDWEFSAQAGEQTLALIISF